MTSSTSLPRAFANPLLYPNVVNPHFSMTRIDATLPNASSMRARKQLAYPWTAWYTLSMEAIVGELLRFESSGVTHHMAYVPGGGRSLVREKRRKSNRSIAATLRRPNTSTGDKASREFRGGGPLLFGIRRRTAAYVMVPPSFPTNARPQTAGTFPF